MNSKHLAFGLFAALAVFAGFGIMLPQQQAAAHEISDECAAAIEAAFADKRITKSEAEAIRAACL